MKNYSIEQPVREDFISYVFKHKEVYYVGLKVFHKVVEYNQVWNGLFSRTFVKGEERTETKDLYVLSVKDQKSCCHRSEFSYTRNLNFDRLKKFSNKNSAEAVAKDFLQWAKDGVDPFL